MVASEELERAVARELELMDGNLEKLLEQEDDERKDDPNNPTSV